MQSRTCFLTPSFHLFPVLVNDTTHHSHSLLLRLQSSMSNHNFLFKFLPISIQKFVWIHPLKCHEPDHSLAPSPLSLSSEPYHYLSTTTVLQVDFSEKQTLRQSLVCRIFIRRYPWGEYLWRGKVRMQDWSYGEIELWCWLNDSVTGPMGSSGTKMNYQSCPVLDQSGQAFIKNPYLGHC